MLKISNVFKTFKIDNNPLNDKKAIQGVSLQIDNNDFVTVIGGNGSGKSTLLNLIVGSIKQDSGEIFLDNEKLNELKQFKRAKNIGIVFQDPMIGTIPEMTLLENLSLSFNRGKKLSLKWALSKSKREIFKKMLISLDLGLEDRLDSRVSTFSGGQRQAITLLMASMNNPKLLLLDEHTAALDPKTAKKIMSLTQEIVNELKVPTIMITHNMKDAIKFGNRLIMMSEGKIVFESSGKAKEKLTPEELMEKFSTLSGQELPDTIILS